MRFIQRLQTVRLVASRFYDVPDTSEVDATGPTPLGIAAAGKFGDTSHMTKAPSRPEFIILIALMISIVALTTDIMLPALDQISADLGQADGQNSHLVVSILFIGFAVGQLFAGPLSDSFGRRPVIHGGYVLFLIGTFVCLLAPTFEILLAGRVLQGLGIAGPRIVAVAIVRDGYEGRSMARIMSFVMAVFILVPAIAPSIGQILINLSGWQATFVLLVVMAAVTWTWFSLRQPETLAPADRRKLSLRSIGQGIVYICKTRAAIGYTICAGIIFGPFLAYLSLAQRVFQDIYDTGEAFSLWFGAAALAIGSASIVNSRLVERLGMRFLSNLALVLTALVSGAFLLMIWSWDGLPPFALFLGWLLITFFGMGLLFGNLNALAMEPLGKMAGLGAAVVGSLSTVIALPLAYAIGEVLVDSVTPLVIGFGSAAALTLLLSLWAGAD